MSSVYPPSKMSRSKEGWGHLKKFTRVGGNIFFFFTFIKNGKKIFIFLLQNTNKQTKATTLKGYLAKDKISSKIKSRQR